MTTDLDLTDPVFHDEGESTRLHPGPGSCQLIQQRSRPFDLGGGEPFGEPIVDRGEDGPSLYAATLVTVQASEIDGGSQSPQFSVLVLSDADRLPEQFFGPFAVSLPQQKLALVPVQLRREPALASLLHRRQGVVNQRRGLFGLAGDLDRRC